MAKFLPSERAMGLVTILSGLAIPIGVLIGAGPLGATGQAVKVFDSIMWVVNPLGMWAFNDGIEWLDRVFGSSNSQDSPPFFSVIVLYIVGTMLSALLWGFLDRLIFRKK
ncbi:hypothetical protein V2O64_10430 [Verrucomicrobiaceae bacterium 227]